MPRAIRLIPSLITLCNLWAGFLALYLVMQDKPLQASAFVAIALICDALDGNLARLLNATSAFGKELDSLSDIVSFVIAPALLAVHTVTGWEILAAALLYTGAGAYRLARYNCHSDTDPHFKGLPTPAAAFTLVMMMVAYMSVPGTRQETTKTFCEVLLFFFAMLMASKITYPKYTIVPFQRWRLFLLLGLVVMTLGWIFVSLVFGLASAALIFVTCSPLHYLLCCREKTPSSAA